MTPIFSALDAGPQLQAQIVRWKRATDHHQANPADRAAREAVERLVDDPELNRVLPPLGYYEYVAEQRASVAFSHAPALRRRWLPDYGAGAAFQELVAQLGAQLTQAGQPDGTVIQTLSAASATQAWEHFRAGLAQRHSALTRPRARLPHPDEAPQLLAYALTALPGDGWAVAPTGDLHRVLPSYPLRYPPTHGTFPPSVELKNGLLAPCVGWAVLPAGTELDGEPLAMPELVYLSMVGNQKKLKAVWAALMDNKRETMRIPTFSGYRHQLETVACRRLAGKRVYTTFWNDAPLARSGMAHVAIQHASAFAPQANRPFLHLVGEDGTPHLTRFWAQLDDASVYPLAAAWTEQLWQLGCEAGLISRLPSYGCTAYWVNPDETAWAAIVARCAGATQATVETYGAPTADPEAAVAHIVSEDDPDESA